MRGLVVFGVVAWSGSLFLSGYRRRLHFARQSNLDCCSHCAICRRRRLGGWFKMNTTSMNAFKKDFSNSSQIRLLPWYGSKCTLCMRKMRIAFYCVSLCIQMAAPFLYGLLACVALYIYTYRVRSSNRHIKRRFLLLLEFVKTNSRWVLRKIEEDDDNRFIVLIRHLQCNHFEKRKNVKCNEPERKRTKE